MQDRQKMIESVYSMLEDAERLESDEAGMGDIVRLEIEILNLTEPQEVFGRAGNFFKMTVEYSMVLERGREVEEELEVDEETYFRSVRLNGAGAVVAVSERL